MLAGGEGPEAEGLIDCKLAGANRCAANENWG